MEWGELELAFFPISWQFQRRFKAKPIYFSGYFIRITFIPLTSIFHFLIQEVTLSSFQFNFLVNVPSCAEKLAGQL